MVKRVHVFLDNIDNAITINQKDKLTTKFQIIACKYLFFIFFLLVTSVVFAHNGNYDAIVEKVSNNKILVKKNEAVVQPTVINNDSEPDVSNYKAGTTCSITASSSSICQGSSVTIGYTTSNVQTSGSIGQAQYTTNGGSSWTNMTPNTTNNMNYSPTSSTTYGVRVLEQNGSTVACGPHYTTVTVYTKSSATPVLSSPADHAYFYTPSITFNWTHSPGSHPNSRYEIEIDGIWTNKGTSQTHSATVSLGSHTWRVRYYDGCNNAYYTSSYRTFYYYGASTCGTVNHYGQNWTITASTTLQGNHINVGAFTINSGVTVTVDPSCHYFNVEATSINIAGTINANGAGDIGGSGGSGGGQSFGNDSYCYGGGGGAGGGAGAGTGGGNAGNNGGTGECLRQICGNFLCNGNRDGDICGGGGGGGGAGGSYGGTGGGYSWGARGVGYAPSGVAGGIFGSGGSPKSTYGTVDGTDIHWGSGGGGGGGGGGSWSNGSAGGSGGNGGGQVSLISSGPVTISGNIYCNGTNGGGGGSGGGESTDGGYDCTASPYNDCNICPEANFDFSGGAGGAGAGGSGGGIKIQGCGNMNITGTLQAIGGNGGTVGLPQPGNGDCFDWSSGGAGGGGGRIKIFRNPCEPFNLTANISVAGGSGGSHPDGASYSGNSGYNGSASTSINHPDYVALTGGVISETQEVCVGGKPTFTNSTLPTGGNCAASRSYAWMSCTSGCTTPPNNFSLISGATSTNYSVSTGLTETTSYVRRVTSGSCTSYSNIITVTVVADPTAPNLNTATPNNGSTICVGGVVNATFTSGSGGTGCTDEYRYSVNGGSTWTNYTPGSNITATTVGANAIQIQTRRPCSGVGCDGAGTVWATKAQWTVVADPTWSTNTVSPTTLCVGGEVTFSASISGGSGGSVSWVRSTTSGGTGSAVSSPYTESTAGNFYYRPVYTASVEGCNLADGTQTVVTVVADPTAPSLNVATPSNGTTVCVGGVVKATFTSGSGGTGCTDEYRYSVNGGSTWTNYTPGSNITATTVGTNTIQIQTRRPCSGLGCDGAGTIWATKAQWTVVPKPNITVSGATTICPGLSANLLANGSGGTGTATYQWQYYNGSSWVNIGTNSSSYTTDNLMISTDFRCIYSTQGIGCTDANSNTATVTIHFPNTAGLSSDDYVWYGSGSTDWTTASNWLKYNGTDFATVSTIPTENDNVLITHFGTPLTCVSNLPYVAVASGECNSIKITSNAQVILNNSKKLTVKGDLNNAGILTSNTGSIDIAGNWTNTGVFNAGTGTVTFNGNATQTINPGTASSAFNNVVFNNTASGSSDINITQPCTINGVATFTNGVVNFSGSGSLSFGAFATSNIGNANSYVNGVISKSGTSAFNFAVGDGEHWGPCAIATPASNSTITAQYLHSAGPLNWTAAYMCSGSDLHHTSGVEHWLLSSNAATPNVTLYWNADSDVAEPNDLVVSHFNSSTNCWENKGATNIVGTASSGSLTNAISFTSYSPITLGTISAINPLPVELISLSAECDNNNNVLLYWATASEINNDYFEVQRATENFDWKVITKVQGAGFSNTTIYYEYLDRENPNANTYYRLRQVDFDGRSKFSDIISIRCENRMDKPIISVYPNPFNSTLNIEFENWDLNHVEIELLDITSRTIQKWNLKNTLSNFVHEVNLSNLNPAMYMLKIKTSSGVVIRKVEKE